MPRGPLPFWWKRGKRMHARAMCAGALCLIAARGVSLRCARVVTRATRIAC
jgi:hypothetical protein